MLEITIPSKEIFLESNNTFITVQETKLQLEHSLMSIKKWEAKWHVPYLHTEQKTTEQVIDYIRCMTINKVNPECYYGLTEENIIAIRDYINNPMTATTFSDNPNKKPHKKEIYTAEIFYWQMIELNIPIEFQKWHLNQLLTLIHVISAKHEEAEGKNKLSPQAAAARRNALNAKRRAKWHSKG